MPLSFIIMPQTQLPWVIVGPGQTANSGPHLNSKRHAVQYSTCRYCIILYTCTGKPAVCSRVQYLYLYLLYDTRTAQCL